MTQYKPSNIHLVVGDDLAKVLKYVETWKNTFTQRYGDFNILHAKHPEEDWEDIIAALETQALFGDKRLIMIGSIGDLSQKSKVAEEHATILLKLMEGLSEDVILMLYDERIDKRTTFYKELTRLSTIKECNLTRESIDDILEHSRVLQAISSQDHSYCKEILKGPSLNPRHEIEKLTLYAHGKGELLTREDIDILVGPQVGEDGFTLLRALGQGPSAVRRTCKALFSIGEDIHKLLGLVVWQIDSLAKIRDSISMEVPDTSLPGHTGLKPYTIKTLLPMAKKITQTTICGLYRDLHTFDMSIKNGTIQDTSDAQQAFTILLMRFAQQYFTL